MSAAAETPAPTSQPSRSGRLLSLVRKLIDYGRELAATIRQRTAAEPIFAKVRFGTTDLALIFERLIRGLQLANALEARVLRRAAHLDAGRRPGRARPAAKPPAARPVAEVDPGLARLPTAEQIAAEVRRRPIGAVIADICHDLGIRPGHLDRAFWDELSRAIIEHGGSLAGFLRNLSRRVFASGSDRAESGSPVAPPRLTALATGPP